MKLKSILSTLSFLSTTALLANGAIAQSGQPAVCAKYIQKGSPTSTLSVRMSDQDSVQVSVRRNTKGDVTDCMIEHSSGSEPMDKKACTWVSHQRHSLELCREQSSTTAQ